MISLLLTFLLFSPVMAQTGVDSACFGGLNDSVTPAVLGQCESPDLLNTESDLSGSAILKRKGFALVSSLSVATAPVTGSHSFIDGSGNRQDIVCQDRNCAHSVNGNAFAVFLSTAGGTGLAPTRWSFVDVGGILYGANNRYDHVFSYDGTTLLFPSGIPQGTILEMTQDRMAVGDVSGQPNRVHYSSAGAYGSFTVGVNPEDSYFDDFGASGDKIRGIKCIQGNCFIFKSASITLCEMADQYNTQCAVISPNLGTTDPASIVAAGATLYFRAQDKNYWEIEQGKLRQISKKIPNLVKSQSGGLGGGEQGNTQTSQADWNNGTQSPASSWNTVTYNGSIFPSSTSHVDSSTTNFYAGTLNNISTITSPSVGIALTRNTILYPSLNADFATGTSSNWSLSASGLYETTCNGSAVSYSQVVAGGVSGYTYSGKFSTQKCYAMFPTYSCKDQSGNTCTTSYGPSASYKYSFLNGDGTTVRGPTTITSCPITVDLSGLSTDYVRLKFTGTSLTSNSGTMTSGFTIGLGASIVIGCTVNHTGTAVNDTFNWSATLQNSPYLSTGSYYSPVYDIGYSTPVGGIFSAFVSTPAGTSLSYQVRSATSSSGAFNGWTPIADSAHIPLVQEYWQYMSSFTTTYSSYTPVINSIVLNAATTGQFYTQCIQPNTSISAWGTLSCAQTLAGNGSLVYYATSAASCATLPTSAPNTWLTSITNNSTLTVATNTAVRYGWRSLLGSATDQAQVDACTLAWNEGTPTQPAWAVYDSIKNAIYWTSTISGASSANRLLKYDRNLDSWYPFDIAAQAPKFINNSLYFGGAAAGTWNMYGAVDSDAGASVNAYWKSKDFGADKPFQDKTFKTLSILSRNQGTGNMTGTWTLSNSQTGSYTISLSTGAGISYAKSNYNLPLTSPQQFISVRVGNNSSTPFEVLGLGLTWDITPWRVSGP